MANTNSQRALVLCAVAASSWGCGGPASDAEPAPQRGSEQTVVLGIGTAPAGTGAQGGSGATEQPDEPGANMAGSGAFPEDLEEVAGRVPPGVRPVSDFLPLVPDRDDGESQ